MAQDLENDSPSPASDPSARAARVAAFLRNAGLLVVLTFLFVGLPLSVSLNSRAIVYAFAGILALLGLSSFAHAFFFRVQARLLEMLLSLAVASLPTGLMLGAIFEQQNMESDRKLSAVLLSLIPALLILAGSLRALHEAKKKGVTSTWKRLGFLVFGWISTVVMLIVLFAVIVGVFFRR